MHPCRKGYQILQRRLPQAPHAQHGPYAPRASILCKAGLN